MKKLDIEKDGYKLSGSVRRANFGDKIQRDILVSDALTNRSDDTLYQTFAVVLHPRAVACVTEETIVTFPDGAQIFARAITIEQLKSLPPEIGEAWMNAVYDENETWIPGYGMTQSNPEQEKKT